MDEFEKEQKEQQQREQAEHDWREQNERVLRESKGEPDPLDTFNGTDQISDFTDPETEDYPTPPDSGYDGPRSLEQVESYADFKKFAEQFARPYYGPIDADAVETVRQGVDLAKHEISLEQLNARVASSEARARAKYGEAYDRLVDKYVVPTIRDDPRLFEILRWMPDPGEAAFKLATLAKHNGKMPVDAIRRWKSLSPAERDKIGPEEFNDMLTARDWDDGSVEEEEETDKVLDRAAMKRMNRLGPKAFEEALDKFKRTGK
jgi:hypothetical protein